MANGSQLGKSGLGGFTLATSTSFSPATQLGVSRITHSGVQQTLTGTTTIGRWNRPQLGQSRIGLITVRKQFGKTNIRSLGSLSTEVQIQTVAQTVSGTGYTEATVYSAKKAILSSGVGRFRRAKYTVIAGQTLYRTANINLSPLYSFPIYTTAAEQTLINEVFQRATTGRTEVTVYSSKKAVLSSNVGSFKRHRYVVLGPGSMALGALWHTKSADYTIAAGVGLPNISSFTLTFGTGLGQLNHFRRLQVNKFLAVDTANWVKFHLFASTYSSWPGISAFSATLSGQTIRSLDSNVYTSKASSAVRLALGTIQPGGFEGDGITNVAITGSQVSTSGLAATPSTSVAITGSKINNVGWDADGVTNVAITAKRIVNGTDFTMDGLTDCQLTVVTTNVDGWNMDCFTDCEFTCERDVYGSFHMDGSTAWTLDVNINWAGFLNMNGATAVSITPKQVYTFGNTFNLDGKTTVAIVANQAYGFGVEITATGDASCEFVTTQKVGVSGFDCDGVTNYTLDTVADYNVQISFDGTTTVHINAAYIPIIQILCTGVGDSFIDGLVGRFAFINVDGSTSCAPFGVLRAAGFLQFFTGIQTSVAFSGSKKVAAFINCDGSTAMAFNPNQDQFGEIEWGPLDQAFYCLGSFVFTDGAMNPVATSILGLNGTRYILGPDYIFGYIENYLATGSPDFASIPTMSFTISGKTSRSIETGYLGAKKIKKAVGLTRPIGNYNRLAMKSDLTEEFIRFPLFVDEEIDFTQISTSIGFTLGGITSIAGYGVVGRDKEEYVTLGILTNTRLTQETLEILATGDPNVDVTQVCYELLFIPTSNGLVSQVNAEILYLANVGVINGEAVETLAAGNGGSGYINSVALEMMASIKAATLMSQTAAEILATGDPEVQLTQATTEILYQSTTTSFSNAWIEQVSVEAIVAPGGNATIEQLSTEVLNNGEGRAVINSEVIETIHNNDPHAVINSASLEVVNNSTTMQANVKQIAIEVLVRAEVDPTVASLVNNPRFHI
jgi:hypothetical protein